MFDTVDKKNAERLLARGRTERCPGAPSGRCAVRTAVTLMVLLGFVILLTAPAATAHAASPSGRPSADTPSSSPSQIDGFTRTADYWGELEKLAGEVQSTLATIAGHAAAAFPANIPQQQAYIASTLAEKYPGAKYDGTSGSVPLPNNLVAYFAEDLQVSRISDAVPVVGRPSGKNYYIRQRKFECYSGLNSITGLVNRERPGDSLFIEVKFPLFQDAVEKMFAAGPEIRTATSSSGVAVLNDSYELSARTQGMRMDIFAEKFLVTDDVFNFVMQNARDGYRQRHAAEFSAAASSKPAPNVMVPVASDSSSRLRNVGAFFFLLLLAVLALLVALLVLARYFYQRVSSTASSEGRMMSSIKSRSKQRKLFVIDYVKNLGRDAYKLSIVEAYRAKGYEIMEYAGEYPERVNLVLTRNGRRYYLNYKSWIHDRIDVDMVKNLHTAVSQEHVAGGIIIAPAHVSRDVWKFIKKTRIEIVTEERVLTLLKAGKESPEPSVGMPAAPVTGVRDDGFPPKGMVDIDHAARLAVAGAAEKVVEQVVSEQVANLRDTVARAVEQAVTVSLEKIVESMVERSVGNTLRKTVSDSGDEELPGAAASDVKQPVTEAVARAVATYDRRMGHAETPSSDGECQPMALRCARCGKKMRVGTATKGAHAGNKFWVCPDYPSCRSLVPFSGEQRQSPQHSADSDEE